MTAIATNSFKKTVIDRIIDNLDDSGGNYYLAIGKSDQWNTTETVPTTVNTLEEERKFRSSMQSIKKISDGSFVATRYNWSSGTIYKAFSDAVTLTSLGAYYVYTESQRVYICLEQGKDTSGNPVISTINPDTVGTGNIPSRTSDGYVWKYLFTLTALNTNKFLSANFVPVTKITTAGNLIETEQLNVQNAAVKGSIVGYRIVNGGTDYPSSVTGTVVGNGSGGAVTLTVSGGSIVKAIIADSTNGNLALGAGYDYASISITDSNNGAATIEPVISMNGIGADPRDDINARFLMLNSQPAGEEGGDFLVSQDFRQIGILKNPKKHNDSDFVAGTGLVLRKLGLNNVTGTFAADDLIRGNTSNAAAFVDKFDAATNTIFFHQNANSGFKPFTSGEVVTDSDDAGVFGTLNALDSDGEANPFSGELIYIENKSPVTRDTAQTEDVKVIFQL